MTAFDDVFRPFLDEFFRLYPVTATAIGDHQFDGDWTDMTEAGRAERLDAMDRWQADLEGLRDLTADEGIDRDLLLGEIEAMRFTEGELREDAWNPLEWVYLIGEGLFLLIAREFAPLGDRLASVASRLEGLPALLASAKAVIVGVDGRPVGRFQTETALKQLAGVTELIGDALAEADGHADDPAVAAVTPRLRAAAESARAAADDFETHLREVVLPASEGEARLGADLFARKMRHTMRSPELTPERIMAAAEREYNAVRAEMVRIAYDLWPAWVRDRPRPDEDGELVRGVLDAIAADHPAADELLDWCREEVARIEEFCAERDLIGMADEPLDIQWTPVFLRSFGGAMLSSPGPLDKGQKAFFAITPMPDDWTRSGASRTCARTTRGCSASCASTRRCPATTSRVSTRTGAGRLPGRSSRAACSRKDGPST